MSESLRRWLFFVCSAISLSIACKLPAEFMACPVKDLPRGEVGCLNGPNQNAVVACPKKDHSCLVILNANTTVKVHQLEAGFCIQNSDNAITRVTKRGSTTDIQHETAYFQWENPCYMGNEEYVVDSNHARLREAKVCCSKVCHQKEPADWAKDIRSMRMTYVSGAFTGIFAFLLTFSGTYEMYKKRKAKLLVLRNSSQK